MKVERSLTNITPSAEQVQRIEALRQSAKDFASDLITLTLPSREQSLAITHLEETVMWAVKGIILE